MAKTRGNIAAERPLPARTGAPITFFQYEPLQGYRSADVSFAMGAMGNSLGQQANSQLANSNSAMSLAVANTANYFPVANSNLVAQTPTFAMDIAVPPDPTPTGEYVSRGSSEGEMFASRKGLKTNYPAPNVLQIDIDTPEQRAVFDSMIDKIDEAFGVLRAESTVSRSGNTHIYVHLATTVTNTERIALQAILGSDPRRELHSIKSVRNGDPSPSILFELPDGAATTA
jgi:hypothetical protein